MIRRNPEMQNEVRDDILPCIRFFQPPSPAADPSPVFHGPRHGMLIAWHMINVRDRTPYPILTPSSGFTGRPGGAHTCARATVRHAQFEHACFDKFIKVINYSTSFFFLYPSVCFLVATTVFDCFINWLLIYFDVTYRSVRAKRCRFGESAVRYVRSSLWVYGAVTTFPAGTPTFSESSPECKNSLPI